MIRETEWGMGRVVSTIRVPDHYNFSWVEGIPIVNVLHIGLETYSGKCRTNKIGPAVATRFRKYCRKLGSSYAPFSNIQENLSHRPRNIVGVYLKERKFRARKFTIAFLEHENLRQTGQMDYYPSILTRTQVKPHLVQVRSRSRAPLFSFLEGEGGPRDLDRTWTPHFDHLCRK